MKVVLLLLVGGVGLAFSFRHLWKNVLEIRAKPKGSHTAWDFAFNYPATLVWFFYLVVFFGGLIVNNLIFP